MEHNNLPKIGDRLEFPDGDTALVTRLETYLNEEDDKGFYDCVQVVYVIEGDAEEQELSENLDSREGYRFNIMKPLPTNKD